MEERGLRERRKTTKKKKKKRERKKYNTLWLLSYLRILAQLRG